MHAPQDDPGLRLHADPGLQPERTTLAWNRTLLALVVAGLLLLRWVPRHGWFPLVLVLLTLVTALVIAVGQARRYRRAARGIRDGRIEADVVGVLGTTAGVAVLGALAVVVILALPLR